MDLWQMLEQARLDNQSKIVAIEKMIENKEACDEIPAFLRPQELLHKLNYDDLEKTMHAYQAHFNRKIHTVGLELGLDGWAILLEYCMENNRPLEQISNIDIYRIKHPADLALEEHAVYDVAVSYQKNKWYRRIRSFLE